MANEIAVMPTIRNVDFQLPAERIRDWHPWGPHVTSLFNTLSIFFPEGEKFFIQSVRHYRERIPAGPLADAVTAFIGQEGAHGREHRAHNRALQQAGLPAEEIERRVLKLLDFTRKVTFPSQKLAITIALEHFTAIMADHLLEDENGVLDQAEPHFAAMWRWHALEETEHKAVAYDVYMHLFGGGIRGYLQRCFVMLTTSVMFIADIWRFHWFLMKAQGLHTDWKGWGRYLKFAFVHPGPFRKIFLPWLAYFRPGFHPWDHDNRFLLTKWQAGLKDPLLLGRTRTATGAAPLPSPQ